MEEQEKEVIQTETEQEIEQEAEDTTTETEVETEEAEDKGESEQEADESESTDGDSSDDEEETVITFEDKPIEKESEEAPKWVKELRKQNRELKRENREIKAKQQEAAQPGELKLSPKPKLADFDYDADKYETAIDNWHVEKRNYDSKAEEQKKQQEKLTQDWNDKLSSYETKKAELKIADFEDAESTARDALNVTQQGIIVSVSDNPAVVIYALGKNPGKLKELSEIKDPIKFTATVAKLETKLKMTQRKPKTKPEKTLSGGGSSAKTDKVLDDLIANATKPGGMQKLFDYQQKLKK